MAAARGSDVVDPFPTVLGAGGHGGGGGYTSGTRYSHVGLGRSGFVAGGSDMANKQMTAAPGTISYPSWGASDYWDNGVTSTAFTLALP
jgi:hypothetical protein